MHSSLHLFIVQSRFLRGRPPDHRTGPLEGWAHSSGNCRLATRRVVLDFWTIGGSSRSRSCSHCNCRKGPLIHMQLGCLEPTSKAMVGLHCVLPCFVLPSEASTRSLNSRAHENFSHTHTHTHKPSSDTPSSFDSLSFSLVSVAYPSVHLNGIWPDWQRTES